MSNRMQSYSFRGSSLPSWRPWLSRVSGLACFVGAALAGFAVWRDPSTVGVAVFGINVLAGALLIALPEYYRYYAALREMPPLPDRIEEAFDETYENLREVRDALERLGQAYSERAPERSAESSAEWKSELEEALTELRLDCDLLEEKLRPILPDDGKAPGKSLPAGMLAKALSGADKGKGFPLQGSSDNAD